MRCEMMYLRHVAISCTGYWRNQCCLKLPVTRGWDLLVFFPLEQQILKVSRARRRRAKRVSIRNQVEEKNRIIVKWVTSTKTVELVAYTPLIISYMKFYARLICSSLWHWQNYKSRKKRAVVRGKYACQKQPALYTSTGKENKLPNKLINPHTKRN